MRAQWQSSKSDDCYICGFFHFTNVIVPLGFPMESTQYINPEKVSHTYRHTKIYLHFYIPYLLLARKHFVTSQFCFFCAFLQARHPISPCCCFFTIFILGAALTTFTKQHKQKVIKESCDWFLYSLTDNTQVALNTEGNTTLMPKYPPFGNVQSLI